MPLHSILAAVLLAAMHGETSLSGMWQWRKVRAERLLRHEALRLWASGYPALSTVLQRGHMEALGAALRPLLPEKGHYLGDGKVLRGSKRKAGPVRCRC